MAGTKGKKLYTCGECGKKQFIHWKETIRAGRLRCIGCGSARMEVSQMGAESNAEVRAAAEEKTAAAIAHGTGSVIPH